MDISIILQAALIYWLLYLTPILIFGLPAFLIGRKKVEWKTYDFAQTIVPYLLWVIYVLMVGGKGTQTLAGEALVVGAMVPISLWLRVAFAKKMKQEPMALDMLLLSCVLCLLVTFVMPDLSPVQ